MTNASKQVSPVKKTIDIKKKKKDIQIQKKKKLEERKYKRKLRQKELFHEKYKALFFSMKIGMFLCVIMILTYCFMFIRTTSRISTTKQNISKIEEKYETIKAINDSTEYEIFGYIDTVYIINSAINELGMCYPNIKNQIIYFESNTPEYMNQYKNISK